MEGRIHAGVDAASCSETREQVGAATLERLNLSVSAREQLVKAVLREHYEIEASERQIAEMHGVSRTWVWNLLQKVENAERAKGQPVHWRAMFWMYKEGKLGT